ncbi:MAG: acetylserotonin O-methyltransferase [Syntrophobacterales bacterium]|nr:acetylserotonin O-methyltransferase [Syntrophobacterales bacterium]
MSRDKNDKGNEILEELRKFMESRAVFTAVEFGIFDLIDRKGFAMANDIAEELGVNKRALTRLLDCLVALGFIAKTNDTYKLAEKGSFLTSSHPLSILPMVKHHCYLWKNWSYLTEAVTHGFNPHRKEITSSPETQKSFIQAMHVIGRSMAWEIVSSYDASWAKRLLDIGCASGTYAIAFLKKYPQMEAVLFDFPSVIPYAKQRVTEEGLLGRVSFAEGDFYTDELPVGCDLALLSAIVHQNSPEENIDLFRKIHRVLEPGGRILIRDHVMSEDRTWPPAGTIFALNMLVVTPAGDTYTFSELHRFLTEAGFESIRLVRSGPKMDCLVEAIKA